MTYTADGFGTQQGDFCTNTLDGCQGELIISIENCICFLGHPPCSACTDAQLHCDRCGREVDPDFPQTLNTLSKRTTGMNNSLACFLLSDQCRMIRAAYEVNPDGSALENKTYGFKTFDQTIKVGDLVVVPTDTRVGFTVCKVIDVDVDVDFSPANNITYKWVVSKFEKSQYDELVSQEAAAINKIQAAEKNKLKKELRDKLLANLNEDEAKTLLITNTPAPTPSPSVSS